MCFLRQEFRWWLLVPLLKFKQIEIKKHWKTIDVRFEIFLVVGIFDSGIDMQILLNLKDYLVRYNVFMILCHETDLHSWWVLHGITNRTGHRWKVNQEQKYTRKEHSSNYLCIMNTRLRIFSNSLFSLILELYNECLKSLELNDRRIQGKLRECIDKEMNRKGTW